MYKQQLSKNLFQWKLGLTKKTYSGEEAPTTPVGRPGNGAALTAMIAAGSGRSFFGDVLKKKEVFSN